MATWDDVARVCAALPGTTESTSYGNRAWKVGGRAYLWERPLRRRDLDELGDAAPGGDVLGAQVPDEGAKQALVADDPAVYFTTAHFDGFPAVLVRLDAIGLEELAELAGEAWACRAPKRLLAQRPDR